MRAKYGPAPSVGQTWLGVFAQNPVPGSCFCLLGRGLSQVHSHTKASKTPQQTRNRDPRERKSSKPRGSLAC